MTSRKGSRIGGRLGLLSIVQMAIAAVAISIALWRPYTLGKKSLWLGPAETIFVRNPALAWLLAAQLLAIVVWMIFAQPKRMWQWVLALGAAILMAVAWMLTSHPPIFEG